MKIGRMRSRAGWVVFAAWILVTTVVLLSPAQVVRDAQKDIWKSSAMESRVTGKPRKLVAKFINWHGAWFLILAGLSALTPAKPTMKTALILLASLTFYSCSAEVIQELLIPSRSFQCGDMARNEIGIVAGLAIVIGVRRAKQGLKDPVTPGCKSTPIED